MLLALALACSPSIDEVADVSYDHVACDHCGMMVSDPRYSAQLVTTDGDRFEFDDPACAFAFIAEHAPSVRHVWFHDAGDGWLDWQQVAFVPSDGAPMDGGLAAVPVGTEGAISFSEASSRVIGGRK
jgi:hypothetical protein